MDSTINHISPDLVERELVLFSPLYNIFALATKTQKRVVYSKRLNEPIEITLKVFSFPVYVPEIGVLLSLDLTSLKYAKEFYEQISDLNELRNKGAVFTCTVHRHDKETNRFVSWGTIEQHSLAQLQCINDIIALYSSNILNDLMISPSTVVNNLVISPHRWFKIISYGGNSESNVNLYYNFGIVYIARDTLEECKSEQKIYTWSCIPEKAYGINALFIYLYPDGWVIPKRIKLYITEDVKNELAELISADIKGEYFIARLLSFSGYIKCPQGAPNVNINLVESLFPLLQSPYLILPFLFPLSFSSDLKNFVYEYTVPENIVKTILSRIAKFSYTQDPRIVEDFESWLKETNRVLKVEHIDHSYYVKVLNPTIIPYLVKKLVTQRTSDTRLVREFLCERNYDILSILSDINKKKRENEALRRHAPSITEMIIMGVGTYLEKRKKVLSQYINIYKHSVMTARRHQNPLI